MLRRFREYLRWEKEIKAKAKEEVYKEVAAWDRRRKDAEAREWNSKNFHQHNRRKNQKNNVFTDGSQSNSRPTLIQT